MITGFSAKGPLEKPIVIFAGTHSIALTLTHQLGFRGQFSWTYLSNPDQLFGRENIVIIRDRDTVWKHPHCFEILNFINAYQLEKRFILWDVSLDQLSGVRRK